MELDDCGWTKMTTLPGLTTGPGVMRRRESARGVEEDGGKAMRVGMSYDLTHERGMVV